MSTRGRYSLRMMFDLAQRFGTGPEPLTAIAERQDLSELYLEQLASPLRKAGLIVSQRGAAGGYRLSKPPNQISIGEILRVTEGAVAPAECVLENSDCDFAQTCAMHKLYARMRDSINDVVDHTTLADLVDEDDKNERNKPAVCGRGVK